MSLVGKVRSGTKDGMGILTSVVITAFLQYINNLLLQIVPCFNYIDSQFHTHEILKLRKKTKPNN